MLDRFFSCVRSRFAPLVLAAIPVAMFSAIEAQEVVAQQPVSAVPAGPIKDVSFQALWLIESDDANRIEYAGPARESDLADWFPRAVPWHLSRSEWTLVWMEARDTVNCSARFGF